VETQNPHARCANKIFRELPQELTQIRELLLANARIGAEYRRNCMATQSTPVTSLEPIGRATAGPASDIRLWPGLALLVLYWGSRVVVDRLDKFYFLGFLFSLASAGLLVLLYFGWWWLNRRIALGDRLYGFLLIAGGAVIATVLCHKSLGWFGILTTGLPVVLTVWTFWMVVVKRATLDRHRLLSLLVVTATYASFMLVRIEGVDAELTADMRWRWSPTAEELFLAEQVPSAETLPDWTPVVRPGDWTEFRGHNRDGVLHGTAIGTDWRAAPPRLVWRQRVGPAWSSVIVINGRLFTQEQRGDKETVVAYDAATGKQLWVHEDSARFWEQVSGAGPRATPTFDAGRLYTVGGTGILNCLDAATGRSFWSRDLKADAGAEVPMWGFSGSPLVVDGLVVVFAGGSGEHSLRAYRADTGEPAWTAPAGKLSFSSPHLASLAGVKQCLLLSDRGLTAVDPSSGKALWQHGLSTPGAPRTIQPHVVGDAQLAVGTLAGAGIALIEVTPKEDDWSVADRWVSDALRPEFPDLVVYQGHAYGFDTSMFCCIDLPTGKRCWKAGRYGRGQVVLLADQALLLVVSEGGELVLLSANPRHHEELGRFQALDSKTWNHPVLAHGRLYIRNTEEMACYEMQ
jgi:outer membrane protein assembly factor BamB